MALTDVPQPEIPAVQEAVNQIRTKIGAVLAHADSAMLQIRNLVRDHGRAAIAAELGTDAAALLSVYNSLKDAVETGRDVTIEDLPA